MELRRVEPFALAFVTSTAEDLLGLQVVVVANLAPRKLRGVMSEGMMLAADDEDGVSVSSP